MSDLRGLRQLPGLGIGLDARQVIPRLPNLKAVVYEVMPDTAPAAEVARDQLRELRALWESRGSAAAPAPPAPADWEQALATALRGREPVADPGIAVLREPIASVRAGKVADALPLTTRLLLPALGGAAVDNFQKARNATAGFPKIPYARIVSLRSRRWDAVELRQNDL